MVFCENVIVLFYSASVFFVLYYTCPNMTYTLDCAFCYSLQAHIFCPFCPIRLHFWPFDHYILHVYASLLSIWIRFFSSSWHIAGSTVSLVDHDSLQAQVFCPVGIIYVHWIFSSWSWKSHVKHNLLMSIIDWLKVQPDYRICDMWCHRS